jgi:1-acyl-sn-glycerol-3-phosphate acyltransferase
MDKYNIKFYNGVKKVVGVPMKLLFKVRVIGIENIPEGNYILAGNHKSMLDVPLLACNLPTNLHFMGKKELFKKPILTKFFRKVGAFPVDREGVDITAIKTSLKLLKSGETLAIFPEGTRNKTKAITLPFKEGVVKIASKTNKLIVPFGIDGEYKLGKEIILNIGEPIDVNSIPKEEQAEYLEEKVKELILR